jgi:hypothetical protein
MAADYEASWSMTLRFRVSTLLTLTVLLALSMALWHQPDAWWADAAMMAGAIWGAWRLPGGVVRRAYGAALGMAVVALFCAPPQFYEMWSEDGASMPPWTISLVARFALAVTVYVVAMFGVAFVIALPVLWVGQAAMRVYLRVVGPLARPMQEESDRVPASTPLPSPPLQGRGP